MGAGVGVCVGDVVVGAGVGVCVIGLGVPRVVGAFVGLSDDSAFSDLSVFDFLSAFGFLFLSSLPALLSSSLFFGWSPASFFLVVFALVESDALNLLLPRTFVVELARLF